MSILQGLEKQKRKKQSKNQKAKKQSKKQINNIRTIIICNMLAVYSVYTGLKSILESISSILKFVYMKICPFISYIRCF